MGSEKFTKRRSDMREGPAVGVAPDEPELFMPLSD